MQVQHFSKQLFELDVAKAHEAISYAVERQNVAADAQCAAAGDDGSDEAFSALIQC